MSRIRIAELPTIRSGLWVFRDARVPVSAIFKNLRCSPIDEVLENFHVTRDQVQAVLDFAVKSACHLSSLHARHEDHPG